MTYEGKHSMGSTEVRSAWLASSCTHIDSDFDISMLARQATPALLTEAQGRGD